MDDAMRELKERSIWFLWQWVTDKDGRRTKVPCSAKGGPTGTSENWHNTWVDYYAAVQAKERFQAAGVGFKIPDGYFFLDVDHRELDDPLVQKLLTRFDSYAERSVSGGGIHIYGRCDTSRIPTVTDADGKVKLDKTYYMKNPHNGVELYYGGITNRFAVFTGDIIWKKPLRDCTSALLATLEEDMRRDTAASAPIPVSVLPTDDFEAKLFDLVCDLRRQRNGDKFSKLFDEGDISDYGSHSEADAALCAMVAFRVGPEHPELIDTVMRASALYREKWEREDYRNSTIRVGIAACRGVFHHDTQEHPYFIVCDKHGNDKIDATMLAKWTREHLRYYLVRDNGRQAALVYVYENGCYHLYAPEMLKGVIKRYIADYDERLVKMGIVNEAFNQIMTDLNYIPQDELDADELIINFCNGVLHLDDMTLYAHDPAVRSTIQIPCRWTGTATPTPVFDGFIHTLTNGDRGVKQLLLEYMGACLSNIKGWRMKKSLFMVGDGDTGKSQLKSLVERFLGRENHIGIDLGEIEARFGTGAIYGTRLAGSSDMSFLSVDELKTFKKLTGGDSLFAEFKGQQPFRYTYGGLLWFCMNRLPKFGGDDGQWVYDRIMVVNCPNVIPLDKQDKHLLDKLYAEREGIVYQAVQALRTVIANGYRFSEPEPVIDARKKYMTENNTVISFFEECMCPWDKGKIRYHCTTGRIYKVYQAWCRENNNGYAKTAREFRETLAMYKNTSYADMTTRQKGNTYYKEYTLTQEAKDQYPQEYGYDNGDFLSCG